MANAGKISGGKLSGGVIVRGIFTATPQDYLAELDCWYDFLDSTKYTLNGGTNYSAVTDKGPVGRNLSQGTAGLQPIYSAGVGAQFANDYMEASSLINSADGTFFAVVRFDSDGSAETLISQGKSAVADGDAFLIRKEPSPSAGFVANSIRAAWNVSNNSWWSTSQLTGTAWRIIIVRKGDRSIRLGTATEVVSFLGSPRWFSDATGTGYDLLRIGKLSSSSTTGDARFTMKEMFLINRSMTSQEIVQLVNGLRIKYNI